MALELANYIGKNLVHLIDRDEDDAYCFRLHKDRSVPSSARIVDVELIYMFSSFKFGPLAFVP